MSYELKHIRGIPYYLDGTIVRIFELGPDGRPTTTCVDIGTYDAATDTITYYADWKVRVRPNLESFRTGLVIGERDRLRETVVRPSRAKKAPRTPRKQRATKNTASK